MRARWMALLGVAATLTAVALLAAVALPVAGIDPTPSPGAAASPAASPASSQGADPGSGAKNQAKDEATKDEPEVSVTLTGTVGTSTGGDEGGYTLTVAGKVYRLEDGPPWWWGDNDPLKPYVGKTVTVTGEQEGAAGTSVEVLTIGGTTIREPGKPPWAGGWKVVGPKHPGWAQWKVDKLEGKGSGKPKAAKPGNPNEPDESEAPEASPGS